jgi:TolB-like protein
VQPQPRSEPKIEAGAIRSQLEKVLASEIMAGSEQLKRLLRTTVDRALGGDTDGLKEYSLGVEAFDRPTAYDPKLDPIVRVQARRLRAKLDEYYSSAGATDDIRIEMPKGGYAPVFTRREAAPVAPARESRLRLGLALLGFVAMITAAVWWLTRPVPAEPFSVAVLPIMNYTGEPSKQYLADRTTEVLVTELARDKRLRVASRTTTMRYQNTRLSAPEIARELNVRCLVEGGLGVEGDRAFLKLRAVDAIGDRKIWADNFDTAVDDMMATQALAAKSLASAIARSQIKDASAGRLNR